MPELTEMQDTELLIVSKREPFYLSGVLYSWDLSACDKNITIRITAESAVYLFRVNNRSGNGTMLL